MDNRPTRPFSDRLRDMEAVFELLPSAHMSPMERVTVAQLLAAPGQA